MKSISVLIYSYQNKNLPAFVQDVVEKFDPNGYKLSVFIIDQNNVDRGKKFEIEKQNTSISYKYVNWDYVRSPIDYKSEYIKETLSDFFMQLGDEVILNQDWNTYLINLLNAMPEKTVFSGNHDISIKQKNNFFLIDEKSSSDQLNQTQWIDRDFIFCKTADIRTIGYPEGFKYYGEVELMSMDATIKGYKILALPTQTFDNRTRPLTDFQYVSYSLTHNYNNFIRFINENSDKIGVYWDYGVDLKGLLPLPFENNDVEYNQKKGKFDYIGGTRYIDTTKVIN